MKKFLFIVILSIAVITMVALAAQPETFFRLPVRALSGNTHVDNLTKDNFNLLINGKKNEIVHFLKTKRSLSESVSARNFVLAFNIRDYREQIAEGISYFVNNILNEKDSLLLWSPVKVYVIPLNKDKAELIHSIQSIIKTDALQFKKDISNGIASLNEIINKYRKDTSESSGSVNDRTPVGSIRTIAQFFLSNYSREILNFKNRYVLPNIMMTNRVAELLTEKNGPKYIINFQEREIIPNIVEYEKVAAEITRLADTFSGNDMSNATRMYRVLDVIEKTMLISESLPLEDIASSLQAANISYNVILFKSTMERTTIGDSISPDVDSTFTYFAKLTGGMAVTNSNLNDALETIRSHPDIFYELIFRIESPLQEKKISLELTKKTNAKLYYKKLVTGDDLQTLFGSRNRGQIQLSDIHLNGHQLKFSISNFQSSPENLKKHGIVTVQVNLFDKENNLVYTTKKNLDAPKKFINFSITIPSSNKGDFTLSINAVDMVSLKSIQYNQPVTL